MKSKTRCRCRRSKRSKLNKGKTRRNQEGLNEDETKKHVMDKRPKV